MTGDFFSGIEQVELTAGDYRVRMPLFYRDLRGIAAVFPASWLRLRAVLPDRRLTPAQLTPGLGAVQIGIFEYRESDIGPYNELFISPVINSPGYAPVPGYNVVRQLLGLEFYSYAHRVFVSSDTGFAKTRDLLGCDTRTASFEVTEGYEWLTYEVKHEGKLVLRLSGRKVSALDEGIMKNFVSTYPQRQIQRAEVKMNLERYALTFNPRHAELALGDSPLADEVNDLLLTRYPAMYFNTPKAQMILYGPDSLNTTLTRNLVETRERIPVG